MPFELLKSHAGRPLITPEHYLQFLKDNDLIDNFLAPETVILCPVGGLYKAEIVKKILQARLSFVDERVAVLTQFGIGAPASVFYQEILYALGVRNIILIGFCGAADITLQVGDLVVAEKAIPGDGVSAQYGAGGEILKCSLKLLNLFSAAAKIDNLPLKNVTTWTTDAFFQETDVKLKVLKEFRAQVVDMETSALYATSSYRQKEALSLMVVSDLLDAAHWKPSYKSLNNELKQIFNFTVMALGKAAVI